MAKKKATGRHKATTEVQLKAVENGFRLMEAPKYSKDRLITPLGMEEINRLNLRGVSPYKIADVIGVNPDTIYYHLKHSIPSLRKKIRLDVEDNLALADEMIRTAWDGFAKSQGEETSEQLEETLLDTDNPDKLQLSKRVLKTLQRDGNTNWLGVIQWCMDHKAKIGGMYQQDRTNDKDLRVAGKTPEEVQEELTDRIMKRLAERGGVNVEEN
jgi:hypothetical protein